MITAIVWFLIGALIGLSSFVYWATANQDMNSACQSWPSTGEPGDDQ
jgi:tryptophan-rich sensory protein